MADLITLQADGTVRMAQPGVKAPVVEVYEDYACPACLEFAKGENSKWLRHAAFSGEIVVVFHPFTLFSAKTPVQRANSRRALTASLCVPTPGKWLEYHDALYAHQPGPFKRGGFPYKKLVRLAKSTGIPVEPFFACLKSAETAKRADKVTELVFGRGIEGTPTVRYKGEELDWSVPWWPEED
ncbi:DsbA family protein [Sinosporangium siamense]|uniref:Thioredoxin-like fold domain-containing protein n=1 Tax=Sinosporangium siamense TaxID=1367973 RepID=A0A919RBR7_9ACTN|nr:thioredoxin domain-containing protein [Sinosporangium siamense]GII90552.1 hypothetical protein Ssi02_07830 [Sinosporangium siamense]